MARTQLTISNAEVRFGAAPDHRWRGPCDAHELLLPIHRGPHRGVGQRDRRAGDLLRAFLASAPCRLRSALVCSGLQDWGVAGSLSEFLFLHDGEVQAFAMYLNGAEDPRATGICSVSAGRLRRPSRHGARPGRRPSRSWVAPTSPRPTAPRSVPTPVAPSPPPAPPPASPGTWTPVGCHSSRQPAPPTTDRSPPSPATAWTTGQYVSPGRRQRSGPLGRHRLGHRQDAP